MRKFTLLGVFMLAMLSITPAWAVKKLMEVGDPITDVGTFTTGTQIMFFNNGRSTYMYENASDYEFLMNKTEPTTGSADGMAYVFTVNRTIAGADTTYTFQANSGKYIETLVSGGPDYSGATPTTFKIKKAGDGTWYFIDNTSGLYMNGNAANLAGWNAEGANSVYKAFTVTVQDVQLYDINDLTSYYNSVLKAVYPVDATHPGYYPQAPVKAYTDLIESTRQVVDGEVEKSDEEIDALYKSLSAAKSKLDTMATNPIIDGYYYIRSGYPAFYTSQSVYKAMRFGASNTVLAWGTIDSLSADYIFYIKKEVDGKYSIQSFATSKYVGLQTAQSSTIPMTDALATEQTFPALGQGQFNILGVGSTYSYHTGGHSSGAGVSGNVVTWNGVANEASAWFLDPVTNTQMLDSLKNIANQTALNVKLNSLISKASGAYENAFSWDVDKTQPLVLSADDAGDCQFSSNYKEPTEGTYAALIDGQWGTGAGFFHSAWSVASAAKHYLQVDLRDKPQQTFAFFTAKRIGNNNNRPTDIVISATNDTVNGGTWTTIKEIKSGLPTAAADSFYTSPGIDLGASYKFIRFTVMATNTNATESTSTGFPFFTYSEFQLYPASLNTTNSQSTRMGEVVPALKTAITTATTVYTGGKATQADIDALQTAYDKFMALYADTTQFSADLKAASDLITGAVEGTEPGQVATGSIAPFQTAIDAAKAYNLKAITASDLATASTKLAAAKKVFLAGIGKVKTGVWYYIVNAQTAGVTGSRFGNYLYTSADSAATLGVGGSDESGNISDEYKFSPYCMWRFTAATDSTYTLQNLGSSFFLGKSAGTASAAFAMSAKGQEYKMSYVGNGGFQIVNLKNTFPLHADANLNVVGWKSGLGTASCWKVSEIDPTSVDNLQLTLRPNSIRIVTMPIALNNGGIVADMKTYQICGKTTNDTNAVVAIKLKEVSAIPAGEPFIIQMGDYTKFDAADDSTTVQAIFTVDDFSQIAMVSAPSSNNGLIGNFATTSFARKGYGYFKNSKLESSGLTKVTINAGTGYINDTQITNDATATVALTLVVNNSGVLSDISSAVGVAPTTRVDVFTLNGVRVAKNVEASEALKGLQKGIYIVGKTKRSVK